MTFAGMLLTSKPPWLVLVISLSISFFAAYITDLQVKETGNERFKRQTAALNYDIYHRLETYQSLLRAGVGMMNASGAVSRDEWYRYVATLEVDRLFQGVQGIGYSQYFSHNEKASYVESIRNEGFPDFTLRPEGERAFYSPVTYLEPFDWRNQRAFGYDMFSEPVRRAAMERARDTGELSISGIVILVQETEEDVQQGFLMYLPVYKTGLIPDSIAQRQKQLRGFVYAPFRINKLLSDISIKAGDALKFTILDEDSGSKVLFTSDPDNAAQDGQFRRTISMPFGGRTWRLEMISSQKYDAEQGDGSAVIVLAVGLVGSLILFVMTVILYFHKRTAQGHAQLLAEQLHISKKFQRMADFAPTALVTVDEEGMVDLYNQEALRLFGYSKEELQGCSVEQLVPQRFRGEHPAYRANYLKKPEQRAMGSGRDLYCQTKNGVELPVEIAIMPAQLNRSGYTVCSIVDISERKRQEDLLLRKSQELEQFVYAVSHDLKSPLVAISGLAEMASQDVASENFSTISTYLNRVIANTKQMEILLNDLLELSRVAYKKLDIDKIYVNEFVDELRVLHEESVLSVGGDFKVVGVGKCFFAHKTLLHQLFSNLIGNAIKYRDVARPLCVNVLVSVDDSGDMRAAVTDNGVGIEPSWQTRVFDLFVRKDSTDKTGSGVGLSICKAVVDRHGGKLGLDSELGQGSKFTIYIPSKKI